MSCKKLQAMKSSTVNKLKNDAKEMYDRRMSMMRVTAEEMEATVDIMSLEYNLWDVKDFNPEAREMYLRRVEHHEFMSNLLKNKMKEVKEEEPEPVKEAPENEEDKEAEDEKQQEEEKQEEEKMLYDVPYVYRTSEKRLNKHPHNYMASSFGF